MCIYIYTHHIQYMNVMIHSKRDSAAMFLPSGPCFSFRRNNHLENKQHVREAMVLVYQLWYCCLLGNKFLLKELLQSYYFSFRNKLLL